MSTEQDIEKRELKNEIMVLRNENRGYETELTRLRREQVASDNQRIADQIRFVEESKFSNDRQIESKEMQILEVQRQINKQGKARQHLCRFI